MINKLKSALLILRGKAYAIPYATFYEAMLFEATGAKKVDMSKICEPTKWESGDL